MSDERSRSRERERVPKRPGRPDGGASPEGSAPTAADPGGPAGGSGRGGSGDAAGGSFGRAPTRVVLAVAAALAIAIGGFTMLSGGDSVSQDEVQARQDAYATFAAGPGLPLTPVAPEDVDRAIAEMPATVSEEQRTELRQRVEAGNRPPCMAHALGHACRGWRHPTLRKQLELPD